MWGGLPSSIRTNDPPTLPDPTSTRRMRNEPFGAVEKEKAIASTVYHAKEIYFKETHRPMPAHHNSP
jgi:hypothetical protein